MPFIVRWVGTVKPSIVSNTLIDFTDILPTFADIGGGDLPRGHIIDGQSFAPYLRGEAVDGPRSWIMAMGGLNQAEVSEVGIENEYIYRDRVLRDKQYKVYLTASYPPKPYKLIDLINDPTEEVNILGHGDDKANAALSKLMKVASTFPARDSDPHYRRRQALSWDLPVAVKSQDWKNSNAEGGAVRQKR